MTLTLHGPDRRKIKSWLVVRLFEVHYSVAALTAWMLELSPGWLGKLFQQWLLR